jgi:hypothetical protein
VRKTVIIVIVLVIIFWLSYKFIDHQSSDAFIIDAAQGTVESAAPQLVNTKQNYGFRLVNIGNKKVKLLQIELLDYQGIKISDLTINGKPFSAQTIPSHRVYFGRRSWFGSNSWSTNSQGVNIDYIVEFKEPVIKNPQNVFITYSYMGLKHKQKIKIPSSALH